MHAEEAVWKINVFISYQEVCHLQGHMSWSGGFVEKIHRCKQTLEDNLFQTKATDKTVLRNITAVTLTVTGYCLFNRSVAILTDEK